MLENIKKTSFYHLYISIVILFFFFKSVLDKRGIDGRLSSAQTALMLQEETIRRNERERKAMADKINSLERAVAAAESEKRQLQVSV